MCCSCCRNRFRTTFLILGSCSCRYSYTIALLFRATFTLNFFFGRSLTHKFYTFLCFGFVALCYAARMRRLFSHFYTLPILEATCTIVIYLSHYTRKSVLSRELFDNLSTLCYPLRGTKGQHQPANTKMYVGVTAKTSPRVGLF